jgi:hypothetical protein
MAFKYVSMRLASFALLVSLAACTVPAVTSPSTPTEAVPTSSPPTVPAATPQPTDVADAVGTPVYEPDQAALQGFAYDGWLTYLNAAYGFSLRYPPQWVVAEATDPNDTMFQHRVTLSDPADPAVALHIAFRAANETARITPSGMGGGELIARGSLAFLGEEIQRQALVGEGKDMGVIYAASGEIARGDLVFWIGLNYAGSPLTDPGLSAEVEMLADAVIGSVALSR